MDLIKIEKDRARVAVIDVDWTRTVKLGKISLPSLREIIEGKLRIGKDENLITGFQVKSVGTIYDILKEDTQLIRRTLSPHLENDSDLVRLRVAHLLKEFQNGLTVAYSNILNALLFELILPNKSNIDSLDKSQVEKLLSKIDEYKHNVNSTFTKAISSCRNDSYMAKKFFEKRQNEFLERIENYSGDLNCRSLHLELHLKIEEIKQKIQVVNPEIEKKSKIISAWGGDIDQIVIVSIPSILTAICVILQIGSRVILFFKNAPSISYSQSDWQYIQIYVAIWLAFIAYSSGIIYINCERKKLKVELRGYNDEKRNLEQALQANKNARSRNQFN